MSEILEVKGLSKRYAKRGDYTVEDLSFDCREGEITGLLGHNGAGKSTTIKCIEGMLAYEAGEISVCGQDVRRQALSAKANMGFVTDDHAVFVKMTGREYLDFMSDVYKVPQKMRKSRYERLEEVFALGGAVGDLIATYSHGMRQKICMMGSLMHRPRLWILDEPMTGLDPRTMRAVKEYMQKYVAEGNAILFSSHALETVEKLCDRVVLLKRGRRLDVYDMNRLRGTGFALQEVFFANA